MNSLRFFIVFFSVLIVNPSCKAQLDKDKNRTTVASSAPVEVFYFHFTRRCITCQTVEAQSKQSILELYGDKVSFNAYNLDEPDGETKGKELGVSGQTLLIVSGDTKIDLTSEGFMYARSNPEKLREILKCKIDPLL